MAAPPPSNTKGFGDQRYRHAIALLVDARKAANLSQKALATKLCRHQQFVSRYETGERRLDVVEFIDISRALALDPIILLQAVPILAAEI